MATAKKPDTCGIIILGNSGVGKSFIGNVILNEEAFKHAYKSHAVTTETEYEECKVGEKIYAIYNIPGLIEADQNRVDINKREIGIAFQKHPYAVVLYVFGDQNGRIRNEDVVAFNAINSAYPLSEKSLIIIVNGVDSDRPAEYDDETTSHLRQLLKIDFPSICYVSKMKTTPQKQALRQQLIKTITQAIPKTHKKEHEIHLQVDELAKLTKQINEFQQQVAAEREQYKLEMERLKKEFDLKQKQQAELARKYEKQQEEDKRLREEDRRRYEEQLRETQDNQKRLEDQLKNQKIQAAAASTPPRMRSLSSTRSSLPRNNQTQFTRRFDALLRRVVEKTLSIMTPKKQKEYSNDLREIVIKHFLNGDTELEIAQKVLIPRTSVHCIIAKYKSTKCIGNIMGRGRKRKTTAHVDRCIQRKIKINRRISASSVKAELQIELNIDISESTVRRRAYKVGLYGRVARKKPYVNRFDRAKRIEYAQTYPEMSLGFWDNVIWSDESKFNLFGSDGKVTVWRTTKEEFNPECAVPTVKHGGGNVKCWGCFSSSGVGNPAFIDGNMAGELYRDILQKNLVDSMKKDQPKNEKELKEALSRVWYGIEKQVLKKLVDSVPNRLNEVIRMEGHPTRY